MNINFTFGKYDISFNARARLNFNEFKRLKYEGEVVFIWWKFFLNIEDWTLEKYALCAECHSPEISEVGYGDEGWTVCESCRSVEQGYVYVNKREFEKL